MKCRAALGLMRRRALSGDEVEAVLMEGPHDQAALRELLHAVRRPADPAELAGLEAAVAAFRDAPAPSASSWHAAAPRTRLAGRLAGRLAASALGVKVALACVGAAALGGIAYAAAGGTVPGTSHHAPRTGDTVASSAHGQPAVPPSAQPTPGARPSETGGPGSGPAGPAHPGTAATSVAPTASLRGLCVSWLAAARDPNRAVGPRYAKLIHAAGGPTGVTAYCGLLTNPSPTGGPRSSGAGKSSHAPVSPPAGRSARPAHPTHPARPTPSPSKRATPGS